MFDRLRWKLTAFNTIITSTILLGMTILCLFISERSTLTQAFRNFNENLKTVSSYLEEQNRLSASWLGQMENVGHFYISIRDGGKTLYSMRLSAERSRLAPEFQQAWEQASQVLDSGETCTFSFHGVNGTSYYTGASLLSKDDSSLELILLYPLTEMEGRILRQRLGVCLAALLAIGFFGGILLVLYRENASSHSGKPAASGAICCRCFP